MGNYFIHLSFHLKLMFATTKEFSEIVGILKAVSFNKWIPFDFFLVFFFVCVAKQKNQAVNGYFQMSVSAK